MNVFKVGDWVVNTTHIGYTPFQLKDSDFYGVSKKNQVFFTNLKFWKPQEGEWMWINTRVDSFPFIACLVTQIKADNTLVFTDYSYTTRGQRKDILMHLNELISLEPFIGTLPSFLTN